MAVSLSIIHEVRLGFQTDFFNKYQDQFDSEVCVTIVYGRAQPELMLSFLAFTPQQAERVAAGLQKMSAAGSAGTIVAEGIISLELVLA